MTNNDDLVKRMRENRFELIRPANILALLAERDADKKRIAELEEKQRLIDICQGQGLEHRIAAEKRAEDAEKRISELREYYEGVIADGSKRIAELEARTVSVKLPERCECCYSEQEAALFDGIVEEYTEALKTACAEAGIKLDVGE